MQMVNPHSEHEALVGRDMITHETRQDGGDSVSSGLDDTFLHGPVD